MGQPTPPGDLPLIEGLGPEWNEFVSALPEDKRSELAPRLKERVTEYENRLKEYEPWDEFRKSGITPEQADTAVSLFATIENNPREVYEAIGRHLNITPAQAKEVVKEIDKADDSNPEIQQMKQQLDTMAQVMLAQRDMSAQEQMAAEADAAVDAEINEVLEKYGDDVPEEEILMRMVHMDMSAEEAYQHYQGRAAEIRKTRPAPMIMGQGGSIPSKAGIDVTKLDNKSTKSLVAQMLDHSNAARRNG